MTVQPSIELTKDGFGNGRVTFVNFVFFDFFFFWNIAIYRPYKSNVVDAPEHLMCDKKICDRDELKHELKSKFTTYFTLGIHNIRLYFIYLYSIFKHINYRIEHGKVRRAGLYVGFVLE